MPRIELTTNAQRVGVGPIIVQSDIPYQFQFTTVAIGGTPADDDFVTGNLGGQFVIIKHNHTDRELHARRYNPDTPVVLNVSPG